ncbi:hypothetical protein BDW42DRAFT_178178 [Aspergillus taichungensis]|uniref:Uncharacterized protein n=1 Tax=Aspergillus taichungensis TaxID=482145 RepID=A0A2J5HI28_9EURO|nr:hypothetical protein BDW42DRAFT_178178 [Aspergillus taichungensis]
METASKIWHTAADAFRDDLHALEGRGTSDNAKHLSQEQHRQQHGEEPISGVPGRGTVTDPYDAGNRDDQPGAVKGQEATVPVNEAQTSLPSSHLQPTYETKKTTLPDRSTTGSSAPGAAGAGAHSGTFTKGGVDSSSNIWVPGQPDLEQRDAGLGLSGYGRNAPEPRTATTTGTQTSKIAALGDTDVRATGGGIGATGATGSGSASAGRYSEPVSAPTAASTSSTSGPPKDFIGGTDVRGTTSQYAEPVSTPTAPSTASTFSPPPRSSGGGDAFAKAGVPAREEEEETLGSRSVSAAEEPSVLRMPSSISDERRSKYHEANANTRDVDPDVLRGPSVSGINEQTKIRFEKEAEKAAKEDSGTSPANIPLASGPGTRERSAMPTDADTSEATEQEKKQTLPKEQSGLTGAGQQQQQDESTSAGRAQSGHQVLDKSEQTEKRTSTMGQSNASERQASQAVQDAEQRDTIGSSSGGGDAGNRKPQVQQGVSKEALQGPQGPPPKEYEFEKELSSGKAGKGGSKTADIPDSKGTGTGQKAQQAKQEVKQADQTAQNGTKSNMKEKLEKVLHHK